MNKALSITATGVGGSGVAVVGAYTLGAFDGSSSKGKDHSVKFKKQNIEEFEKEKGGICVSKLMPGNIEDMNKASVSDTLDDNFLGESNDKDRSCLVIDWQKTQDPKNPKENIFTLIWSFTNNDGKAIVIFFLAKVTSTNSTPSIEASAYAFDKENEEWKIKHRKKSENTTTILSPPDYNNHFPKAGTQLKTTANIKEDYWGFLPSDKKDGGTGWRKEFTWEKQNPPATGESLTSWTSNPEWLDQVFPGWKLKDKLGKFTGKSWKEVTQNQAQ